MVSPIYTSRFTKQIFKINPHIDQSIATISCTCLEFLTILKSVLPIMTNFFLCVPLKVSLLTSHTWLVIIFFALLLKFFICHSLLVTLYLSLFTCHVYIPLLTCHSWLVALCLSIFTCLASYILCSNNIVFIFL